MAFIGDILAGTSVGLNTPSTQGGVGANMSWLDKLTKNPEQLFITMDELGGKMTGLGPIVAPQIQSSIAARNKAAEAKLAEGRFAQLLEALGGEVGGQNIQGLFPEASGAAGALGDQGFTSADAPGRTSVTEKAGPGGNTIRTTTETIPRKDKQKSYVSDLFSNP